MWIERTHVLVVSGNGEMKNLYLVRPLNKNIKIQKVYVHPVMNLEL